MLETYSAYASRRLLSADDGDKLAINKRPATGGQVMKPARRGSGGGACVSAGSLKFSLLLLLASSTRCQQESSSSLRSLDSRNSESYAANRSEANRNNVIPSTGK